jgi:hypothetical protein
LIFHRTKIGADSLTNKLQARGYAAEAMHGDLSQAQREALIKRLRDGRVEIVVATDVAARGLDVERIGSVINYDMPGDTESYVHRIGRTARAGREGTAVLFVTPRQQRMKRDIETYIKQQIPPMKLPTQADVASRRINLFKERILKTLVDEELDLYLSLIEELVEESGRDMSEIAAAAAFLGSGDKPLEVPIEPKIEQFSFREEDMVRLFVDVGRSHRISPADIVGAVANEGGVPGKAIGAIDIYDRFTFVDVPSELVQQVLSQMSSTRVRGQNANIRLASSHDTLNDSRQSRGSQRESNQRNDSWEKPPRRQPEKKSRVSEHAERFEDNVRRNAKPANTFDAKPPRSKAKPVNTFAAPFDNTTGAKPPRKTPSRSKLTSPFSLPEDRPRRKKTTDFDKPTARRAPTDDFDFVEDRPKRKAKTETNSGSAFSKFAGKSYSKAAPAKGKGKKTIGKGKKKSKR